MSYHYIGEPFPEYTPDKNYIDDRVPVLGIDQYNVGGKKNKIDEKPIEKKPVDEKPVDFNNQEKCWS